MIMEARWMLLTLFLVELSLQDNILDSLVTKGSGLKSLISKQTRRHLTCAYSGEKGKDEPYHYMTCPTDSKCVAVIAYQVLKNELAPVEVRKGCQGTTIKTLNCSNTCTLEKLTETRTQYRQYLYCCCDQNLCNQVEKNDYDPRETLNFATVVPVIQGKNGNNSTMLLTAIISSVTFFLIVLCFSVIWVWRKIEKRHKPYVDAQNLLHQTQLVTSKPKTMSEETLDSILRGNLIHQGCNSAVRLGMIKGKPVAVKVFPPRSKMQWMNEKEICSVLGDHPNIAKFITSEQTPQEFGFEGIIVMIYYSEGSLLNYLRKLSLSWKQMIRLAYCITNGLSYLHSETNRDGSPKISIAHRDLKSRNILVKSDGTCVIADFGVSLRLKGKYLKYARFPLVGSPRYMAPEILDGSIIQSDWHTAFKQVDCYGLGLLLWELTRRCHEILRPGCDIPECLLPYEEELGPGPCVYKVLNHVCFKNQRPAFPEQWLQDNVSLAYMKQTIVECWDQEGDARLTPSCVLNRLKQMEDLAMTEKDIFKETMNNVEIFCGEVDGRSEQDLSNVQMMPTNNSGLLQKV